MTCVRSRSIAAALFALLLLVSSDTPAAQSPPPTGQQKTLVIVADFTDQVVSCSTSVIQTSVFGPTLSVDSLLRDNSAGKLFLDGDVVGPVALNRSSTDPCSLSGLAMAAEAAASAAGVDVDAYPRRLYVMPPNSCGAGGHGTLGGQPSQAWIFTCEMPGIYAHNLGHNLGMSHAASATPLPDEEYGDPSDPMAFGSNRLPGFNAPHRHQMGWLASSALMDVSHDADLGIAALDVPAGLAGAPQVLRIRKPDTGEFYYLSYRRPQGFDQYMDSRFYERLSVHRYKGDGSSATTYLVGRLADGESFTDAANGVTITLVDRAAGLANVRVRFSGGTCQPASPSLGLTPASQEGASGSTLHYELTLTNNDGSACAPTSFALDGIVPTGWAATLSSSLLTIAGGETGTATLSLTSAGSAVAGDYVGRIDVASAVTAHQASATVIYRVTAKADTQAPTTPAALTARVRSKRVELTWSPAADNVRVAGYRIWRDALVVASIQTATWTDASPLAGREHTYQVQAFDAAGNVSGLSDPATASVGGRRK